MAVVALGLVAFVAIFSREGLTPTANRFMDALAVGDIDKLTSLSYLGGKSEAQMRKEWQFATQVAGKHYNFMWHINSEQQDSPTAGSVKIIVQRNFGKPGTYDENFALPMVNVNGHWKVDPTGISNEMYPGLPRAGT
jgi:hypothetical protein